MKKINTPVYLVYLLILLLFSCSSPKMAYFNNSNPVRLLNEKSKSSNQESIIESKNNISHISQLNQNLPSIGSPISEEKTNPKNNPRLKDFRPTEVKNISNPAPKLNKEEKKEIINYIKEAGSNKSTKATNLSKGILVIIAIILPPLAVALVDGITGPFWLSIVLTLLFYLPGLLYALYRIFRTS